MSGFRHVGDSVLHEGHVISLSRSTYEAPDGSTFERDIVRHPGAVSVVPLLDNGDVVLVRQYRAAIDSVAIEIPAGKRDVPGEPTETTAQRELIEEVGFRAGRLDLLVRFHNSIGFSDEESFVYLGRDLIEAPMDRQGIEESYMDILRVPLIDTPEMIRVGTITDAKTVIGLSVAIAILGPG